MGPSWRAEVQVKTIAIQSNSHHLAAVQQMWRQDSSTLGFFPQGAFADYAAKGGDRRRPQQCVHIAQRSVC